MVILVDTNIIIDALANREPYADDAKRIMERCAAREITGILTLKNWQVYICPRIHGTRFQRKEKRVQIIMLKWMKRYFCLN